MDFNTVLKMIILVSVTLLLAYVALNAALTFLSRFADQVKKAGKNLLVGAGVIYAIGLLLMPEYILEISQPLIRLVEKIAPGLLAM